jgi:hypothetical protein
MALGQHTSKGIPFFIEEISIGQKPFFNLQRFKGKVALDVRYHHSDHASLEYFFNEEGKLIGKAIDSRIGDLLRPVSRRIEVLATGNFLNSILFGSITLI